MRRLFVLSFLLLTAAKSEKPKRGQEPAPTPEPAAVEAPAPVEEAEPPPPPEPEPPAVVKNIDFQVALAWANGTTKSGHVTGVERTVDFNGYEGWTADAKKLKLVVECGTTEKEVAWTDVKSITITPGKAPDGVDCTSTSDVTPVMYECTMRTTTAVVLKDGTKGNITNRHMWRFTWEDGTTTELQVYKYTVRAPDTYVAVRGEEDTSDPFLALQETLAAELKTGLLKTITMP